MKVIFMQIYNIKNINEIVITDYTNLFSNIKICLIFEKVFTNNSFAVVEKKFITSDERKS